MQTLTKFIIFCIAMIIIYVIIAIMFQYTNQQQLPDSLTVAYFGFFGTELCAAAFVKYMKLKYEHKGEEED